MPPRWLLASCVGHRARGRRFRRQQRRRRKSDEVRVQHGPDGRGGHGHVKLGADNTEGEGVVGDREGDGRQLLSRGRGRRRTTGEGPGVWNRVN